MKNSGNTVTMFPYYAKQTVGIIKKLLIVAAFGFEKPAEIQ